MQQIRRNAFIFFALTLLLLTSCNHKKTDEPTTRTDTIPMLVMQIQKCSKLYTAECHIHKIITHDDNLSLKGTFMKKDYDIALPFGKRKIAIPMDATVKAYIDFAGFSQANVRRQGDKIEVILPDPKITLTSTRIDRNEVKQYVSITRSNFSDAELTNYERQGRQAIIDVIPSLDITDMARESAANILIPMITKAGFKEENITITFRKDLNKNDIKSLLDKTNIENGKK